MEATGGAFNLTKNTNIISFKSISNEAKYLAQILKTGFGETPKVKKQGEGFILKLDGKLFDHYGEVGYSLNVDKKSIEIKAATNTGIFYGIQSLRQLLPPNFEFSQIPQSSINIPCVKITDHPRFVWRAFMLDEARHFKGMETVKGLLDQMALLKMNVFHWHLTDDQGWRIEIKKYPKLTEIGRL